MSKAALFLVGIILLLWVVGGTEWYRKQYCTILPPAQTAAVNQSPPTLLVGNEVLQYNTPIYFQYGYAKPLLTGEGVVFVGKLVRYLRQNPDKKLIVKGKYGARETPSVTEAQNTDLGLARAEAIKAVIVQLGLNERDIDIVSEKKSQIAFQGNQITHGVDFSIQPKLAAAVPSLNLFFKKNQFQFKETDELAQYFSYLKRLIRQNPDILIKIKACADSGEKNSIAEKRLINMTTYLRELDINMAQIIAEKETIKTTGATNETMRNQKIEIRITTL